MPPSCHENLEHKASRSRSRRPAQPHCSIADAIQRPILRLKMVASASLKMWLKAAAVVGLILGCHAGPNSPNAECDGDDKCIESEKETAAANNVSDTPPTPKNSSSKRVPMPPTDRGLPQQPTEQQGDNREPRLLIQPVRRLRNVSVEEFDRIYSPPNVAVPIVFEDSMTDTFDPADWTKEAIIRDCGDIPLINPNGFRDQSCAEVSTEEEGSHRDCHVVRYVDKRTIRYEWAGLKVADLNKFDIKTMADLLRIQDTPEGSHLYLHDAPMSWYCPPRVDKVRVPKYFHTDYRNLLNDEYMPNRMDYLLGTFPDIFISNKGTGSPLHADSEMTRFYFQLLSGKKHWRLLPPSDYWRAGPQMHYGDIYPSRFGASIMEPDFERYPKLDGALVYETILNPGDVIFVPEGWGHEVVNLEDSMATSINFIDHHAMNAHLEYLKAGMGASKVRQTPYSDFIYMQQCKYEAERGFKAKEIQTWEIKKAMKKCVKGGDWGELDYSHHHYAYFYEIVNSYFFPLDPPTNENENIDYGDWMNSHHFLRREVPKSAKDFVASRNQFKNGINSYRSENGFPALHVAVIANFAAVVSYLLDHGASLLERDHSGWTARDVALRLGHKDVLKRIDWHWNDRGRKQFGEYIELYTDALF